jgi:hypothetical protein
VQSGFAADHASTLAKAHDPAAEPLWHRQILG